MELDLLTAISPVDGRYRGKTELLASYFSEYALIRYRVRVEVEYFIALCELPLPQLQDFPVEFDRLRDIYRNFSEQDAQRVKDIEKVTNHDVKAVEYFIKEKFDEIGGLDKFKEFIHFGLTSQDINNTSVPLSLKEALDEVYYPQLEELIAQLEQYAEDWKDVPMLAKTHGQPASPTRLGKEIRVFTYRLRRQMEMLKLQSAQIDYENAKDARRQKNDPKLLELTRLAEEARLNKSIRDNQYSERDDEYKRRKEDYDFAKLEKDMDNLHKSNEEKAVDNLRRRAETEELNAKIRKFDNAKFYEETESSARKAVANAVEEALNIYNDPASSGPQKAEAFKIINSFIVSGNKNK